MITDVLDVLRCPRCRTPLHVVDADGTVVVGCDGPHRFDVARQGHLNLLGTAAPAHADTPAMVAARLRHLAGGAHDRLRERLVAGADGVVLDAGAGPGWYLAGLPADQRCLALDISAAAARRAATAHPRVGAVVADTWADWPVADASVDTVWCVFAPRNAAEFARVLRPTGTLRVVIPGPAHLQELVDTGAMIGRQPDKEQRVVDQLAGRFRPTGRDELTDRIRLTGPQVDDVVAMGPSAHHRRPFEARPPATVTTAFVVLDFVPA